MPVILTSIRCRLLALALAAGVLAVFSPSASAVSAAVPTASCVDGNFQDGLDTRYAATYCAATLNAAGYSATALSGTDAAPVLEQESTDGIFYHAGHALVVGGGNSATAIASVMPGPGAAGTFQGLLGDPAAADFQGPTQVCDGSGHCRNVTMVNVPYESQMQKFNLAVFQSCNSGRDGVQGYNSLATIAYSLGVVGTSIGFKDEVSWITNAPGDNVAGDAFARRFWSDAKAGTDYLTALIDGVNAAGGSTYGYSSYVYLHDPSAPNHLRPAQYFLP